MFYEDDLPLVGQLKFERQAWFARCDDQQMEPNFKQLREVLLTEQGLRQMLPSLHTALVLYLVLSATRVRLNAHLACLRDC